MTERRNKQTFELRGNDWVLKGTKVETSQRGLPDREKDLLGFACSANDGWFRGSGDTEYFEALGDFRDHVQESHTKPDKDGLAQSVHLDRVYRLGASNKKF